MNLITGNWGGAWDAVKGILASAWDLIKSVVSLGVSVVVGLLSGVWATITNLTSACWDGIRDKVGGVVEFIKGIPGSIAGALSGMWDGLKNGFRSAINWIIDKWNGLHFTTPNIPGTDFGSQDIGTPQLPRLHAGGTFIPPFGHNEGAVILRAGEVVDPPASGVTRPAIGPSGDTQVAAGLASLERAVSALADKVAESDGDQTIQLVLDGHVLAEVNARGQRTRAGLLR